VLHGGDSCYSFWFIDQGRQGQSVSKSWVVGFEGGQLWRDASRCSFAPWRPGDIVLPGIFEEIEIDLSVSFRKK
jgi:hypothetical protein